MKTAESKKTILSVCQSARPKTAGAQGCLACGSQELAEKLETLIAEAGLSETAEVRFGGCLRFCNSGPVIMILPDRVIYTKLNEAKLQRIVQEHLKEGRKVEELIEETSSGWF